MSLIPSLRLGLREITPLARTVRSAGKFLHHSIPRLADRATGQSPGTAGTTLDAGSAGLETCLGPQGDDVCLPVGSIRPAPGASNPTLTHRDVTDYGRVDFVADPFAVPRGDTWHLFFEVCNHDRSPDAVIGHAVSRDGLAWEYDRVVLDPGRHASFPYVFRWDGDYYMVPEEGGGAGRTVTLYEAASFPTDWRQTATIIDDGCRTDDTVLFRWEDRWYAMVGDMATDSLRVYHSRSLTDDDWTPHAGNPVVDGRPRAGRPGGRPIVGEDGITLFLQDCRRRYGDKLRAYEIGELSPDTYTDREHSESPVLAGTGAAIGWNSGAMHHVDPWFLGDKTGVTTDGRGGSARWMCLVDGNVNLGRRLFSSSHWSIGLYTAARREREPVTTGRER